MYGSRVVDPRHPYESSIAGELIAKNSDGAITLAITTIAKDPPPKQQSALLKPLEMAEGGHFTVESRSESEESSGGEETMATGQMDSVESSDFAAACGAAAAAKEESLHQDGLEKLLEQNRR